MTNKIIIGILAVATLILGGMYFSAKNLGGSGIGPTHYQTENFLQGLFGGTTGQFQITNSGVVTSTAGITVDSVKLDNGTALLEASCVTKSFDPASFSSSTMASTTIAQPGAALGDTVAASFDSATSTGQWYVVGRISGAATTTISWVAVPGSDAWNAGLNLTTSTFRTCYQGY